MGNIPERVLMMRKAWAENDARRDAGLTEPESLEKHRDISYGPNGTENLLDLYIPKDRSGKATPGDCPWPVIVSIHGGGFFYGDKELYRFYCMHLAESGFAVVNFNYRLAPESHFPAPLEDTMAVMEWIAANAKAYDLDPGNVFLVGDSAGAQLVSQFACIMTNGAYRYLFGMKAPDIRIRAISLACGTYRFAPGEDGRPAGILLDYFGDEDLLRDPRTEILSNITSDYPPTYIFSSYCDMLYAECEPTAEWIAARGVEVVCRIFGSPEAKEIGHVFHVNLRLPEGEKANREQIEFFRKHIAASGEKREEQV